MAELFANNRQWQRNCDAVMARDGSSCHYCGRPTFIPEEIDAQLSLATMAWRGSARAWRYREREITRQVRVLDHKVARSNGGKTHPDNLLIACAYCNSVKSNKPYEVAVALIRACVAEQGARWGHYVEASREDL